MAHSGESESMADETKPVQNGLKELAITVDFVVEFGDRNNARFRWPIGDRILRGWWKKANLAKTESDDRFAPMPDLPGLRLRVSGLHRSAEIRDPLASPGAEKVLLKAKAIIKICFNEDQGTEDPQQFADLTDSEIKEYCYWTRRMLDAEQCEVVTGTVPEMDEIRKMPGKIRKGNFDMTSSAVEERPAGDVGRYVKVKVA